MLKIFADALLIAARLGQVPPTLRKVRGDGPTMGRS